MTGIHDRLATRLERARRSGDDGTALILALIVVLVVGTMLAAVLDFTRAGLTIVPGERDDRNTSNYVQGAVHAAINQVRGSTTLGTDGVGRCAAPPAAADYTAPQPSGTVTGVTGRAFTVSCTGQPTGSTGGLDRPKYVIHAVNSAADEGIRQVAPGNDLLYINGGIHSSGLVSVSGANNLMHVNGTVTAVKGCNGPLTTSDLAGKNCTAAASAEDDPPAYDPAIASTTALHNAIDAGSLNVGADPVPTCVGGQVNFTPGYYSETPEELVARHLGTTCGNVYNFHPVEDSTGTPTATGVYYFDYDGQNGDGKWEIGDIKLIGGKLTSTTLDGACEYAEQGTTPGVQFMFGGASKMYVKSSTGGITGGIEICGPEYGSSLGGGPNAQTAAQRIALYAVSSRNAVSSPAPTSAELHYTAATATAFIDPGNATEIDGPPFATANFTGGNIATMDYGRIPSPPRKGSTVTAVGVRVAQAIANANASLVLSVPGRTPVRVTIPNSHRVCVLETCNLINILPQLEALDVAWRALTQVSIRYEVDPTNASATATLDGIQLEVTYREPALRAITCTAVTTGTDCLFLESEQNARVFFHGTVYAPSAALKVWIHNSGRTLFDRGVIVRDIAINMNSSSKQTESPFQLPAGTPTGRLVLFVGRVDGVEKVRACVRYVDQAPMPDGGVSAYAGWSLSVPRWLVQRTPTGVTAACP